LFLLDDDIAELLGLLLISFRDLFHSLFKLLGAQSPIPIRVEVSKQLCVVFFFFIRDEKGRKVGKESLLDLHGVECQDGRLVIHLSVLVDVGFHLLVILRVVFIDPLVIHDVYSIQSFLRFKLEHLLNELRDRIRVALELFSLKINQVFLRHKVEFLYQLIFQVLPRHLIVKLPKWMLLSN